MQIFNLNHGTTSSSYVPHAEQNLPFTLEEGEELFFGDTLEDDGKYHRSVEVVLDGTENWIINPAVTLTNSFVSDNAFPNRKTRGNVLCSHFTVVETVNEEGLFNGSALNFITSEFSTVEEWKTYLAEQYANGTPVKLVYELDEEEIVPYNSTQQAQNNAIKKAHSYNDITYIESKSDELPPILEVQYWKKNDTEVITSSENENKVEFIEDENSPITIITNADTFAEQILNNEESEVIEDEANN